MNAAARLLVPAALAVFACTLTGCVTIALPPPAEPGTLTAQPRASASTPTAETVQSDCAGSPLSLEGDGTTTVVTGDCPLVTISGVDLTVDLTAARVTSIVVRGDRVSIDAADVGSLEIAGTQNVGDARALGALALNGDRNQITAHGAIGAATVSGNDNHVVGDPISAVTDSGDRNVIGRD